MTAPTSGVAGILLRPYRERVRRLAPVLALLAVLPLAGCSAAAHANAKPAPATRTVHGTLTLTGHNWISENGQAGEVCTALDGYTDITAGTEVDVTDSAGKVIALGHLADGTVTDDAANCSFPFAVGGVPTKTGIYGIQVGHRGTIHYSAADLRNGPALTLGD